MPMPRPILIASARRVADANATNTNRQKYSPQWIHGEYFTTWPSHYFENLSATDNTLTYWSYCPWFSSTPYTRDDGPGGTPEVVIPTMRLASDNQPHHYHVNHNGTSGLTEPLWPTGHDSHVDDGDDLVWQERGTERPSTRVRLFYGIEYKPSGNTSCGSVGAELRRPRKSPWEAITAPSRHTSFPWTRFPPGERKSACTAWSMQTMCRLPSTICLF